MNIETCISIVAAYFYSEFLKLTSQRASFSASDFAQIMRTRYTDWLITTPLMLLGLSLVLAHHHGAGHRVTLLYMFVVFFFNYAMLLGGFYAERHRASDKRAFNALTGGSFLAFFALFATVYAYLVHGSGATANYATFFLFASLWLAYGGAHMLRDDILKNTIYNVLDLLSKCVVGILFWVYFTKIIVVC